MEDNWYRQFHVVVMGLDSIEARRYINKVYCSFLEFEREFVVITVFDLRYSMTTEGCLLHKTLKNKPYLRITIGPSAKQSPGIPYVLEFWPPGSKSAVHNHGSVCAIIKVVFGTIQNGTFNKMPSTVVDNKGSAKTVQPDELFRFDCYNGEVMWMSPKW